MKNLLVTALIITIVPLISTSQKENIVRNGGFEEDADGNGMAVHWQFAGDEGVTATWGRDDGFSGRF
ncbi:MAG: hypothetical protein ACYTEO_04835, partial [Planctomycetota bacterium]